MTKISLSDLAHIDHSKPVLIAGPTASGKSDLALKIAQQFGGRIINADALQVYSNWRVLSARPSVEDEATADHALYGHLPFDAEYSVGHWLRELPTFLNAQERPIIVGGTGLYFTALTQGLVDLPQIPEKIRNEASLRAQKSGYQVFLKEIAMETQKQLDTQNPMRVQRAWEVQKATGKPLHVWHAQTPPPVLPLDQCFPILVESQKDVLNSRIERRFEQMLVSGAVEEVEAQLDHWDPSLLSSKAIGAAELVSYLKGEISIEEAQIRATIATRQFAKRQRTWFRSKMKHWNRIELSAL